ncbi:MAG: hypothetical protein KAH32_03355 [Chlamydiia bacterium]|nr:hypothetical protein [Chlamydiia bacterium]
MKKLLLGIGTSLTIATPVVAVVACSDTETNNTIKRQDVALTQNADTVYSGGY